MPGCGLRIAFIRTGCDLLPSIEAFEVMEVTLGSVPQSQTLPNDVLMQLDGCSH